jgi:hypothetical protein
MTIHLAKVKKFARLAVMATAVAAAGLGLGAGTAQATPKHPDPIPHTTPQQIDNFFDRFTPEGTPADKFFDRFTGVK